MNTSAQIDSAWWDTASLWINEVGTLPRIGLILAGAIVVWSAGRLLIRSVVSGISRGLDAAETAAREVLARGDRETTDADLEDRLEAQRRSTRAHTIGVVLRAALNVTIVVITSLMILQELQVSVTPILASAGVVGVALGFGAQSLVKDVLSGIFMLIEDQYGVGDVVDLGEASGTVENFGLRSTRIRALDGTVWYVPNGEIRRVGNKTQLWSRVMIEVRFDLDVDVEKARTAMLDAVTEARKEPRIAEAILEEPRVPGVESLEYNAVMLRLLIQVQPSQQWTVQRAVRAQMHALFRKRRIALAAPENALIQRDRTSGGSA